MSQSTLDDQAPFEAVTISFARKLGSSEQFTTVFREGMALVERTAAYLDGEGRKQAKLLPAAVSVAYATESMRLTTRLLEVASWLLIRRALNEGEITEQEAMAKGARFKLRTLSRPSHISRLNELPEGLQSLIQESFALTDRVAQLDEAIAPDNTAKAKAVAGNPVGERLRSLEQAFGGSGFAAAGQKA